MEEGAEKQEAPLSRKTDSLAKKDEFSSNVSDFEKSLFEAGTLQFDLEKEVRKARERLGNQKDWYEKNPHWDDQRTAESMARDYGDAHYNLIWKERFGGKVPQNWDIWYNVMDDFEAAQESEVQLSKELVDAGISHPHHLVANAAGKSQKLNKRQLAWLFVRPEFPEWNFSEIIEAQRKKGVSDEVIREAQQIAEDLIKTRENGKSISNRSSRKLEG